MNRSMFMDAVGMVDADIVEAYVLKDMALRSRKRSKTKRYLVTLLAAAISMLLVIALLVTSLPLVYITNREAIDSVVSETIDRVIFPLDDEDADIKQEDLLLNWTEWPITEQVFNALGAGTENSVIDWLTGEHGGLAGEAWQSLGKILQKLLDYYLKHHQETEQEKENEQEQTQQPDVPNATYYHDGCTYTYNNYWAYYELTTVHHILEEKNGVLHIPDEILGVPVGEISREACRNVKELTTLIMPDSIESIGIRAFEGCENLAEVRFSTQLKSMGEFAFAGCHALKSIELPDQLTSIGNNAFANCQGLASVYLPDTLEKIPEDCFGGCVNLGYVEMGDSVTTIEASAFVGCTALESITLSQTLTSIGLRAFEHSGLKEVDFPTGVTAIGEYAFANCNQLSHVTLSDRISEIGIGAFSNTALRQIVMPVNIISIGEDAFDTVTYVEYGDTMGLWCGDIYRTGGFIFADQARVKCTDGECYADFTTELGYGHNGMAGEIYAMEFGIFNEHKTDECIILPPYTAGPLAILNAIDEAACISNKYLKRFYMPDTVVHIKQGAFLDCSSLEYVKLSDTLEIIEKDAFKLCTALTSLTLPSSVKQIGEAAFAECTLLERIEYRGTMEQWYAIEIAEDALMSGTTIVCTDGEIVIE